MSNTYKKAFMFGGVFATNLSININIDGESASVSVARANVQQRGGVE